MKQHITENQWKEISKEKRDKLFIALEKNLMDNRGRYFYIKMPTIGDMIEFLGDDLSQIDNEKLENQELEKIWTIWFDEGRGFGRFSAIELVDILWEAVKQKMNRKPPRKCALLSVIEKFKLTQ